MYSETSTRMSSIPPKANTAHHSMPSSRLVSGTPITQAVSAGSSQCGTMLLPER